MTRLFISAHKWKSLNFRLTFPDRVYRLRPYSSYSRDESAIPKLRWLELRRLLKATSLVGLAVGGTGIVAEIVLLSTVLSQWSLSFRDPSGMIILALLSSSFLLPLISALCLLILPLKDEQRDILGFVALISSIVAWIPTYYVGLILYCNTIHSTCS